MPSYSRSQAAEVEACCITAATIAISKQLARPCHLVWLCLDTSLWSWTEMDGGRSNVGCRVGQGI